MKRFSIILAVCSLLIAPAGIRGEAAPKKIRIGILDLTTRGGGEDVAAAVNDYVASEFGSLGLYLPYDQEIIEKGLSQLKITLRHCSDPRCVIDIGKALGLDRMVYGVFDYSDKTPGIQLTVMDVQSRQEIEKVSLVAQPGVSAADLVHVAVLKLHGHDPADTDKKVQRYFGPEIHHEKEMLYSTGVFLSVGLVWTLASGGVGGDYRPAPWEGEYSSMAKSGIASADYHIPMFARPAALANCYLANSDDAYGVLYNPAGMAWVAGREVSIAYQSRYGDLNNLSASYVNKATREIGFGHALWLVRDNAGLQTSTHFISAAAYKLNSLFGFMPPVSAGLSLRFRSVSTPEDIEGATASQRTFGVGLDFGFLAELSERIRYGAVLKNLPGVERVGNPTANWAYGESQPTTLNMGGAFKAGYATNLLANGQIPLYDDQSWKMAGGIEQEIFRVFMLRIGIEKEIQTLIDTPWKFSGGFGLKIETDMWGGKYLYLDGSYEYNTLQIFDIINVSLRLGF